VIDADRNRQPGLLRNDEFGILYIKGFRRQRLVQEDEPRHFIFNTCGSEI